MREDGVHPVSARLVLLPMPLPLHTLPLHTLPLHTLPLHTLPSVAQCYCTYQYTLCGMCIVGATLYYQYDIHHCIVWSVPPYVCYMYVTHVPRYMA